MKVIRIIWLWRGRRLKDGGGLIRLLDLLKKKGMVMDQEDKVQIGKFSILFYLYHCLVLPCILKKESLKITMEITMTTFHWTNFLRLKESRLLANTEVMIHTIQLSVKNFKQEVRVAQTFCSKNRKKKDLDGTILLTIKKDK